MVVTTSDRPTSLSVETIDCLGSPTVSMIGGVRCLTCQRRRLGRGEFSHVRLSGIITRSVLGQRCRGCVMTDRTMTLM